MSLSIKLQSSDGEIFTVDAATIEQMVTIQTMIDHEDEDSDEVTPVPTVNSKVLEKIIQWTEYHKVDHEKTEKMAWYTKYFNVGMNYKFEIIIAADYLEVDSLLNESCHNIFINNNLEIIEKAVSNFHNPKVINPLKKYEREHGYDVIVTVQKGKHLGYFDTKVRILFMIKGNILFIF